VDYLETLLTQLRNWYFVLMNKTQVRNLKNHYGSRWTAYRHNQKNQDKILLLEDRFVVSNCLPGAILAVDCLGEVYQIILDVDTVSTGRKYNTILMLNNIKFKYLTLPALVELINLQAGTAKRLIININLMFLIYDRVNQSIDNVSKYIIQHLIDFNLVKQIYNLNFNYGFGQLFLVLDRND
jgi:hypothetical protein